MRLQAHIHIRHVLNADIQRIRYAAQNFGRKLSVVGKVQFIFLKLKNSFFWAAVVPIFTNDHEFSMYF